MKVTFPNIDLKMEEQAKLHPYYLGIFQGKLGALIGLLCGIYYSFGGMLIDIGVSYGLLSAERMSTPGLSIGTLMAFGALIGMPLIFMFIGFICGLAQAFSYNLISRLLPSLSISKNNWEKIWKI